MPIDVRVTIRCDGVGCHEGEDCDDLLTVREATDWGRANGWTVGKRVLCPVHQTPEALRLIREREAEVAEISRQMEAHRRRVTCPERQ